MNEVKLSESDRLALLEAARVAEAGVQEYQALSKRLAAKYRVPWPRPALDLEAGVFRGPKKP